MKNSERLLVFFEPEATVAETRCDYFEGCSVNELCKIHATPNHASCLHLLLFRDGIEPRALRQVNNSGPPVRVNSGHF
jgi:hypothetical protein